MKKEILENQIKTWLTNQIMKGDDVKIVDIFYKKNLSKEHDKRLRQVNNIDLLDFVTDFSILMNINNVPQVGFINRVVNSIGLREIGEMQVYCRVAKPLFAFLISSKGFSSEIGAFLLNELVVENLFSYENHHIIGFQMVDSSPVNDSILPITYRENLWTNLN